MTLPARPSPLHKVALQERNEPGELIFISIASYRDIQLVPTVGDLLAKADVPALLRFGICWQHGPEEGRPHTYCGIFITRLAACVRVMFASSLVNFERSSSWSSETLLNSRAFPSR